jgi:phosphosulfolactate synthase (CoM biosynthesis protein A)
VASNITSLTRASTRLDMEKKEDVNNGHLKKLLSMRALKPYDAKREYNELNDFIEIIKSNLKMVNIAPNEVTKLAYIRSQLWGDAQS